ncbi:hypothetical protein [Brachybacterium paraconglomeratum]|uniref:hypothetical protein n=1 Tax=Brachybacterium paraconglomeratum TaxID=173362 RepID=UPI0022B006A7|nr:hypothetical protein [Brachybacterium paraconglomeratum]MCZ4326765.1 hypothetical protein [Brachybacterium paraconglomeratum]
MSKPIGKVIAAAAALVLLVGGIWFAVARDGAESGTEETTAAASSPSDNESSEAPVTQGPDASAPPEITGDYTDPEQVALAFAYAYPGDVDALADPTFLASLDGADASLAEKITDIRVEEIDHDSGDIDERYAFTVSGTLDGIEVQAYTITMSRPVEAEEGGLDAENNFEFRVASFDWSPELAGEGDTTGPAANLINPITARQRADLLTETREGAITEVLTHVPEETEEERQGRLAPVVAEPTTVDAPMSRSGRYAMKVEILSQSYSTEHGGPITLEYTGTWVDPYDPTYHGAWALTATIARDQTGGLAVQSVTESTPAEGNGHDE